MTTITQLLKAFAMLTFVFISIWTGYVWLPLVVLIVLGIWAISLTFKNS